MSFWPSGRGVLHRGIGESLIETQPYQASPQLAFKPRAEHACTSLCAGEAPYRPPPAFTSISHFTVN